jgi:arylsulfatase A-like enzyme
LSGEIIALINDVTSTISDLLGVKPPTVFDGVPQMRMHGAGFRAVRSGANAPPPRDRQCTNCAATAIWHNGWKAVTVRVHPAFRRRPVAAVRSEH